MKVISCFVLCVAIIFPTAFSDLQGRENAPFVPSSRSRQTRSGRDFDTLMGHSFGESKRAHVESKKNFDEIDAAGFNDFSKRNFDEIDAAGFNGIVKKNFDEIDNAGFKDYLRKRNFDEIDAAGFNDLSKRSKLAAAIRNKELSPDVFQPMMIQNGMQRRNFDEIDAAGFNGFSKREKASTKNGRLASIIVPSRNPVHPSTLFPMEDMERYQSGIYSDIYSPIEIDQNDRYYLPTTGRYASWSPFPLYMSGHTYPPVKPKYADVSTFVPPFYPAPQYESIAPFYSGSSPNGPLGSNQGMGRKMNSDSFRPSRQECTAMGDGKAIREESRKLYRTLNGKKPSPDYQ